MTSSGDRRDGQTAEVELGRGGLGVGGEDIEQLWGVSVVLSGIRGTWLSEESLN